jgi:hypothetical protein
MTLEILPFFNFIGGNLLSCLAVVQDALLKVTAQQLCCIIANAISENRKGQPVWTCKSLRLVGMPFHCERLAICRNNSSGNEFINFHVHVIVAFTRKAVNLTLTFSVANWLCAEGETNFSDAGWFWLSVTGYASLELVNVHHWLPGTVSSKGF